MLVESTSYPDCFNAVPADYQMRGKYLGEFPGQVSENVHSLNISDACSKEERWGRTASPQFSREEVEPFPSPPGP